MGKRKTTKKKQASLYVLPIGVLLAIVPLIVHYHEFESGLEQFNWYAKEGTVGDVFLYYKSAMITLLSAIMCASCCCVLKRIRKALSLAGAFIRFWFMRP